MNAAAGERGPGGHGGAALAQLGDRLAQPEGQWQRFDSVAHTGLKKLLYLDPQRTPFFQSLFGFY